MTESSSLSTLVAACGRAARASSAGLVSADDPTIDRALRAIANRLVAAHDVVMDANRADLAAALEGGVPPALIDRLRLDAASITAMASELATLASAPFPRRSRTVRALPDGLRLDEYRRPVGVIGANYEARPDVTLDIASQLIKSRNAGVLRTGSAALRSAIALVDAVVAPGLEEAGLAADAVTLIRDPDREAARALVREPALIPLVILRGSGPTTRSLALEAARHGVRTLAHAEGGGVLYIDEDADPGVALRLIEAGLDRLGVCNRLNLLLVHLSFWAQRRSDITGLLERLGISPSLPPHDHPRGHEWALDEGNEARVTIDTVGDVTEAVAIANDETSGLAAAVATEDAGTARRFLAGYRGTGAFWNSSTRLLDGFKLLGLPETGINVDHVPGPRGPVTFRDLYLRQFVVIPEDRAGG